MYFRLVKEKGKVKLLENKIWGKLTLTIFTLLAYVQLFSTDYLVGTLNANNRVFIIVMFWLFTPIFSCKRPFAVELFLFNSYDRSIKDKYEISNIYPETVFGQ